MFVVAIKCGVALAEITVSYGHLVMPVKPGSDTASSCMQPPTAIKTGIIPYRGV